MLSIAVPAGLLIGLLLGALGGGSILTVPVLVYLLGQNRTRPRPGRCSSWGSRRPPG